MLDWRLIQARIQPRVKLWYFFFLSNVPKQKKFGGIKEKIGERFCVAWITSIKLGCILCEMVDDFFAFNSLLKGENAKTKTGLINDLCSVFC